MKKIESIDQLKKESIEGAEFVIMINTILRSTKFVTYLPKKDKFSIHNFIDDTHQTVKADRLLEETLIPEAIEAGRFFKDKED